MKQQKPQQLLLYCTEVHQVLLKPFVDSGTEVLQ